MKTPQKLILVKNRLNQDLVYTSQDWPTKEIDGVQFISVKVKKDDQYLKLMRKDHLERVK
jgi:hypothetical protein